MMAVIEHIVKHQHAYRLVAGELDEKWKDCLMKRTALNEIETRMATGPQMKDVYATAIQAVPELAFIVPNFW